MAPRMLLISESITTNSAVHTVARPASPTELYWFGFATGALVLLFFVLVYVSGQDEPEEEDGMWMEEDEERGRMGEDVEVLGPPPAYSADPNWNVVYTREWVTA